MTLADVLPTQSCIITGYSGVNKRILAMGLTRGIQITVIRVAPLGDPMELKVRSYELFLRKADATTILVEKI